VVRERKIPAHRLSGVRRCVWRFRKHELDAILCCHPLTLLREQYEGPATRKRSVRYDKRRKTWNYSGMTANSPVKANWDEAEFPTKERHEEVDALSQQPKAQIGDTVLSVD